MTIRAGALRDRIEIYKHVVTKDQYGARESSLEKVGDFWAEVNHEADFVSGNKFEMANTTMRAKTRYNYSLDQPTNKMILRFRGNDYSISSVINPRMKNEYLLITATLTGE
ncbi:conserved hypothetical protein [Vibrio chagasii]|nr:conserved hypothetical protein [Vibrio chagasii]